MSEVVDVTIIAARCGECDTVHPIMYKHRHSAVCRDCLNNKGIIMSLHPLLKVIDTEAPAALPSDYMTWTEYEATQK
jgi:hypothetical protein